MKKYNVENFTQRELFEVIKERKNYLIETLELGNATHNELKWVDNTLILYKFNGKIPLINIGYNLKGEAITILEKNVKDLREEINYHKKLFKGVLTRKEFQEIKNYVKTLNIKEKSDNKYLIETLNLECYIISIDE